MRARWAVLMMPPDLAQRERPGRATQGDSDNTFGDDSSMPPVIDRFVRDMLTEVLLAADSQWWRAKAEEMEAAAPRPGEYHGRATREELREAWRRCHAAAEACRLRARVSHYDSAREDVADALEAVLS